MKDDAEDREIARYAQAFLRDWRTRALAAVEPFLPVEERDPFKSWLRDMAMKQLGASGMQAIAINDVSGYVRRHAAMWIARDAVPGVH